jgi:exosortase A-associated hydrolase 2
MAPPAHAPAEAFFLPAAGGARFCLFHAPIGRCRGALVYVHPFAEEMNKSRRMAALQARALAALGVGVLLLDLHGCGDSSGEFREARWDGWKDDLARACAWLGERTGRPVGLWGLRLGALLALDYAQSATHPIARLLLWQPVTNGAAYLTQFLRLRMVGELLNEGAGAGTDAMRASLGAGSALEIAGYALAPQLAAAIDGVEASALAPSGCPVDWFEITAAPGRPLPPGAARIASGWREWGAQPRVHLVPGQQFWTTQEIAECPALLDATSALYREAAHAA